jgi:hypothetical protein
MGTLIHHGPSSAVTEFQSTLYLVAGAEGSGVATLGWLLEKPRFALNHFPKTARFKNTRTLTLSKSTTKRAPLSGYWKLKVRSPVGVVLGSLIRFASVSGAPPWFRLGSRPASKE